MGRSVNFDAVPDTGVVDAGVYQVSIGSLDEKASKSGKLMYDARLEIVEPADFAGMGIFEMFVIGNDEDPDANEESTWIKSIGCRRMKQMLKAAQVPLDTDMDNVIAAAVSQQLVVSVTQETETEGDYAGRVRNRISAFYPLGHKEVGIAPGQASKPKAAAPKPAAPAAPKPNLAPGQQLASPKAPPKAAPAPAAPKAPAPAAAKPAAAKAPTAHCTICDTDVPRTEFADHVEAHANE